MIFFILKPGWAEDALVDKLSAQRSALSEAATMRQMIVSRLYFMSSVGTRIQSFAGRLLNESGSGAC